MPALRPSYQELADELPTQEHLNIDETATKEENGKAWLWTFVARLFTVFAVRPTRETTALDEVDRSCHSDHRRSVPPPL